MKWKLWKFINRNEENAMYKHMNGLWHNEL